MKYEVTLFGTMPVVKTVVVEAENAKEAQQTALLKSEQLDPENKKWMPADDVEVNDFHVECADSDCDCK